MLFVLCLGNNSVTYTNLSVGKHTVRIRARCRGDAWKRKNINFRIRTWLLKLELFIFRPLLLYNARYKTFWTFAIHFSWIIKAVPAQLYRVHIIIIIMLTTIVLKVASISWVSWYSIYNLNFVEINESAVLTYKVINYALLLNLFATNIVLCITHHGIWLLHFTVYCTE